MISDAAISRESIGVLVAVHVLPPEVIEDDERLAYELGRLVNKLCELSVQHPKLAEALKAP